MLHLWKVKYSIAKTQCKLNLRIVWIPRGHMRILFMFNLSCLFTGSTWSLETFNTEAAARICSVKITFLKKFAIFQGKTPLIFSMKFATKLKRNSLRELFLGNFVKVFTTAERYRLQILLLTLSEFKWIN